MTCQETNSSPTQNTMNLTVLAIILLFSFTAEHAVNGFSLELIHRDSIHSPLYPGNLTASEKIKRQVQRSKSHIAAQESAIIAPHDVSIRPVMAHVDYEYMVRVSIGSPPTNLHLQLDTGSSLMWTQCEPCHPCFPQDGPKFNPAASRNFHPIPCDHPLCVPPSYKCEGGVCIYDVSYVDKSFTRGALATDQLTFASKNGQQETIPDLVFGCSHESSPSMFKSTKPGGVIGMNLRGESLIMQLTSRIQGPVRFSYCLPGHNNGISYLRFGTDIVTRGKLQSIPMLRNDYKDYYVELLDVSVNGRRLRLPPGTFKLRPDGTGGCILDTGCEMSTMIRPAYFSVMRATMEYFKQFSLSVVSGRDVGLDLCYSMPNNFRSFPAMDYHFTEATLHVEPENLFSVLPGRFCLLLLPSETFTQIGTPHQRNTLFVYDLGKQTVYFAPENCAQV